MNALAVQVDDTQMQFEALDRGVSDKPDLKIVAEGLSNLVSRAVEVNRWTQNRIGIDDEDQTLNCSSALDRKVDLAEETAGSQLDVRISNAILSAFPKSTVSLSISLEPLQEWEGYVSNISEKSFTARLVDKTLGNTIEDEEADFLIDDLSDEDRQLLVRGAVFRWIIGYQRTTSGTKRRVSQITFRRLPAWTKRELEHARSRAEELASAIQWD